jgi:hypothetical protein
LADRICRRGVVDRGGRFSCVHLHVYADMHASSLDE